MSTYTLKIEQEEYPFDPRQEYDHLGTMLCWHNRYSLGDEAKPPRLGDWLADMLCILRIEYKYDDTQFRPITADMSNWVADVDGYAYGDFLTDLRNEDSAAIEEAWARIYDSGKLLVLPLYLYDHGGITMRTTSFNDPWDSGQVGFIYVKTDDVKQEWGWKRLTKQRREHIETILKGEVEEYDAYLTGDVWYWVIEDTDGDYFDSCGGYYGYDYAKQEAEAALSTIA